MLIFQKFFSQVENFNSWELYRLSTGILALRIRIPRKNYGGVAWSWLLRTSVAASSNIFVPSGHSVGKSPSQVPGDTCSPHELVKPTTGSNTDGHLLIVPCVIIVLCLLTTDGY